jgi:hypothetical protein
MVKETATCAAERAAGAAQETAIQIGHQAAAARDKATAALRELAPNEEARDTVLLGAAALAVAAALGIAYQRRSPD